MVMVVAVVVVVVVVVLMVMVVAVVVVVAVVSHLLQPKYPGHVAAITLSRAEVSVVLYCIVLYCINRRIYLNLLKSTQSAAGLKALKPAANERCPELLAFIT